MESKAQHNIFLCMILSWQRHQGNVQLCVDLILQSLHARTSKETWCHASAKDMRAVLPTHRLPTKLGFFEFTCHGSKNCWAGDLKFGYFSSVCPQKLFFFKFVNFLSIQSAFEPFQWPRTFLSISRIKTSWRAITIDFPLHAEVNDPNVFCPIESFWKLGVWLLDKNWTTLISQQKKPICHGLVLMSFNNTVCKCSDFSASLRSYRKQYIKQDFVPILWIKKYMHNM